MNGNHSTRVIVFLCAASALLAPAGLAAAPMLQVKVVAVGPPQAQIDALEKALPQNEALASLLQGTHYRLLYSEPLTQSGRFRTIFYDYTHEVAIVAESSLGEPAAAVVHLKKNWQPDVPEAEFQEAVAVLSADRAYAPALAARELAPYRPMPPVEGWMGKTARERIVNVGLAPRPGTANVPHEIVGVKMATGTVVRYPGGAPGRAQANATQCGPPSAGQPTTRRGTAGQYQLTVTDDGGQVLWQMLVLRPAISSGTNASGIELQNVKYKGHPVLKRGHVPILNVQYVNNECGPYRDWEYQEGMFQADGVDIPDAPGFRDCGTTPATTLLENGTDTGNFRGVALYRQGTEVVLVTEMEAGWYRYIHEWGFDADGTIHPRFGFGATQNSCTCFDHTHHAYFRFDFDIDGRANSIYEAPLRGAAGGAMPISSETKINRDQSAPKFYRIRGAKRSYLLYPGPNDGIADAYGQADLWFLHWHDGPTPLTAEIDDGHQLFQTTEADLDQFLTGETLTRQDLVVWYHAAFLHMPDNEADGRPTPAEGVIAPALNGPEVVGPDLVPVGY